MGSGGKFLETKVPVGSIVTAYAAIANMEEAIDKTEKLIDEIGKNPNNPKVWKDLALYADRLKSRGMTLVASIKTLIKSQEG